MRLPAISPCPPWIKFIHRDLFNGLCFPEGIRLEDLSGGLSSGCESPFHLDTWISASIITEKM
ncbi:MAG: hypothetical protein ACLVBP_09610 [Ruminococcus sp.]